MPVIIEEVTTEAVKPIATPKSAQPVTEQPGDAETRLRETLSAMRRAEARAERLRAD